MSFKTNFKWRFTFANSAGPWSQANFPTRLEAFEDAVKLISENQKEAEIVHSIVIVDTLRTS